MKIFVKIINLDFNSTMKQIITFVKLLLHESHLMFKSNID